MTIHDELIAKTLMAKPETDEDYLNIDWDTRLITIPSTLTNIGVYNDKDTNRLYFRCPIEYGEFKIADFGLRVNYQNTGISTTKYDGDVYLVDDVESDGEYLTFSWLVGHHAYLEQGATAFIVCCKVIDSDNNVVNELNTTIATLSVLEGLEVDVLPPEDYPDYLEELLRRCEDAENIANEALAKAGSQASVGECFVGKAVEVKGVDCDDFVLTRGAHIMVLFYQGNTVESPSMNVNNTGAYPVYGDMICEGETYILLAFDGNAYYVDSAYSMARKALDSAITSITVNGESVPVEDNTAEIEVVRRGTVSRGGTLTFTGDGVFVICANAEDVMANVWYCTGGARIPITQADFTDCTYDEEYYEITTSVDIEYFIIGATSIE